MMYFVKFMYNRVIPIENLMNLGSVEISKINSLQPR